MAVDKLVDSTQLDSDLTSVANAIRTKGGTSSQLAFPAGFVSAVQAIPTGGGGADLDWIASASPSPSVRNFFNALKTGNYEHGEVSFANTPNSFHDFFTCQNITNLQGFIIIDKDFYHQGGTTVNSGAQAILFLWSDKSFTNSVAAGQSTTKWGALECSVNYANATVAQCLAAGYINIDGSAGILQGFYKWDSETKTMQTKSVYTNNTQYTNLLRNRTYIWIAY